MPKPTFVGEFESSSWQTSTTPKTSASITWLTNDVLVVVGVTGDSASTFNTPTATGLTFTLAQSIVVSNRCSTWLWTAVAGAGGTQAVSLSTASNPNGDVWGMSVIQFRDSDGVGASSKTNASSGAPSLAITTTVANSAILVVNGDWNATDGASRTWRTVNSITPTAGNGLELTYQRGSSTYTSYVAYYDDAGTAASKTVGLSAPSGQAYAIIAVEVKGSTAVATLPVRPARSTVPVMRAATR